MRSLRLFLILIALSQLVLVSLPPTYAASSELKLADKLGVSTTIDTASGLVSLSKDSGEVELGLTLKGTPTTNTKTPDKTTLQYVGFKQEVVTLAEGIELNIVLDSRPAVNAWSWDITAKGLRFYYQPPLDQEAQIDPTWVTVNATTALDKDGKVVAYRAIDVVGSYAVYSDNVYGTTGKVAHIYRPLVIDDKGATTWGTLAIDEEGKTLSVSVDGKWLDSASYPVVVDPIIGYNSAGATYMQFTADAIKGTLFTMGGNNGRLASISANMKVISGTATVKFGVYKHSDLSLIGYTEETTVTTTQGWFTANIHGSAPLLASGVDYVLVAFVDYPSNTVYLYYDAGGVDVYHTQTIAYGAFPNPYAPSSHGTNKASIYGTYDLATWTITATAGNHGSISPSGATSVTDGNNQAYTITPETGYSVESVFVDGVYQGSVTSYTFSTVTADHTITADFNIPVDYTGIYGSIGLLSVGLIVLGAVAVMSVVGGNIDPKLAVMLAGYAIAIIIGTYIIAGLQAAIGG